MKVLIVLENVVMDGTKRATVVMGNNLNKVVPVTFYSLQSGIPFYELDAPFVVASRPSDIDVMNFRGDKPLQRYSEQIEDLTSYIIDQHFTTVILPAGLLTSFASIIKAKAPNVEVIAWMHNNFHTYMYQYYKDMQPEFIRGLQAADQVVTLTDSDFRQYQSYNAHVLKIYNPLTLMAKKCANLESHQIAFTGRIDIQQKGIDFLLNAAQYLPDDWKITIAGDGNAQNMIIFHNLLRQFDVGDKIIYRGPLQDDGLEEHYSDASIFVSTSRWEGLPLVIGEAMNFGLPVVAMENTGTREFLENSRYGILTPAKNVHDFVAALRAAIASYGLRTYYASKSLERIEKFSPKKIIESWQQIIA